MVDDLLRRDVDSGLASEAGEDSRAKHLVVDRDHMEDTVVVHAEGIEACRLALGCHHMANMGWEGKLGSAGQSKDLLVHLG